MERGTREYYAHAACRYFLARTGGACAAGDERCRRLEWCAAVEAIADKAVARKESNERKVDK